MYCTFYTLDFIIHVVRFVDNTLDFLGGADASDLCFPQCFAENVRLVTPSYGYGRTSALVFFS